jgi:hypothetical protein
MPGTLGCAPRTNAAAEDIGAQARPTPFHFSVFIDTNTHANLLQHLTLWTLAAALNSQRGDGNRSYWRNIIHSAFMPCAAIESGYQQQRGNRLDRTVRADHTRIELQIQTGKLH